MACTFIANFLELIEHFFKFSLGILKYLFTNAIHLIPNPLHQRPKPPRHLTGAHALPQLNNHSFNVFLIKTLQAINPQKPLEEPDDEVQHGVADLILRDVRGQNAAAGKFGSGITKHSTLIPNELLKSFGQLGNEATTGISIQSLLNLSKLCTKLGFGLFNALKKVLNLLGKFSDGPTSTTRNLPILTRDNNITRSRQKGAHESAKATEVEAIGATGQGGCARVAEEGGFRGAGGLDVVEEISDVIVTKEVQGGEGRGGGRRWLGSLILERLEERGVGETDIHDRHDTKEDCGAVPLLTVCKRVPSGRGLTRDQSRYGITFNLQNPLPNIIDARRIYVGLAACNEGLQALAEIIKRRVGKVTLSFLVFKPLNHTFANKPIFMENFHGHLAPIFFKKLLKRLGKVIGIVFNLNLNHPVYRLLKIRGWLGKRLLPSHHHLN
ncbi:armadillo-like helical protein [Babesia caballi]|uniref:Armadillo-like helical protein n=1 Tax=Babesia caballi TaxID=5871 RepID=A0AAV4LYC5_BABCB|nr:armadillo-like helical protein [Babesia caballi]